MAVPLFLASASPRRAAILEQLGLPFKANPASVPETPEPGEGPGQFAQRLARDKAEAVAKTLKHSHDACWVLGADTVGVIDGEMLGKPRDAEHAVETLARLAGRSHDVLTGVSVVRCGKDTPQRDGGNGGCRAWSGLAETKVRFVQLSRRTIRAYVATKEPLDKAAAYAIQGRAEPYIERIEGSWSTVVGLPTGLTCRLLEDAGYPLPVRLRLVHTRAGQGLTGGAEIA